MEIPRALERTPTNAAPRPAAGRAARLAEALTLHLVLPAGALLAGWLLFLAAHGDLPPLPRALCVAAVAGFGAFAGFALLRGARLPEAAAFPGSGEPGRRNPP